MDAQRHAWCFWMVVLCQCCVPPISETPDSGCCATGQMVDLVSFSNHGHSFSHSIARTSLGGSL